MGYAYIGYPLALFVIAAFFKVRKADLGYTPSISVLITAYNEDAGIRRKLEQTIALDYPPEKLEIVVVSDGSTDRTDQIVESFPDSRVRLVRVTDRKGKTNAQNIGVSQCSGEVVVFSDATTIYHSESLRYLAANYVDPKAGAVSGRYQYFDRSGVSSTGVGSIAFWSYENLIKYFQSKIYSLTGCSGCIYSVRRSLYTPLPAEALSDVVEPLTVLRQGYRVYFEERALAYEETTRGHSEEFRMRVRVVSRGIAAILSMRELLKVWRYGWISFQLISHKILRWLVPVYLMGIFFSSAVLYEFPVFRYLFFLQLAFYGFAAITLIAPLHRRWSALGIPLYFCTVSLAALFSIVNSIRHRKYVTWETVR